MRGGPPHPEPSTLPSLDLLWMAISPLITFFNPNNFIDDDIATQKIACAPNYLVHTPLKIKNSDGAFARAFAVIF